MKKTHSIFFSILVLMFIVFSCKKEVEPDSEPFSEKSIEQNKGVIENSGIEMANSLDDMKDLNAIEVAISLGEKLDMDDPFGDKFKASKVRSTVNIIAGLRDEKSSYNDVFTVLKSTDELSDPETIQEVWDEIVGIYEWDPSYEVWVNEGGSDKVIFRFPSTPDGQSNDAELTISDYSGIIISNPIDEEYSGDFPTNLNMNVAVNGEILISYTFSASYTDDGTPEMIASDLAIETFKFEIDLTNNNTEASVNSKLIQGDKVVLNVGGSIHGDFSDENIENNIITHTNTYTWTDYVWDEDSQEYVLTEITETDEWEELDVGGVISTAKARLEIFNIALRGEANIKAMIDDDEEIYPDDYWNDPNWDEEAASMAVAKSFNDNMTLYAVDLQENTKIAEAEAYVVKEYDDWGGGDGYYSYWVDFRLKFGDGSTVDMETYFEEGFNDFVDKINEMIWELNGEHDLDMDPIDY